MTDVRPCMSVSDEEAESVPPPPVIAQFTDTPGTGRPCGSSTATTNGFGNCTTVLPFWLSPDTTAIVAGVLPVAVNVTGDPARPEDEAVTVFCPPAEPTVKLTDACPDPIVVVEVAETLPPPAATSHVTPTPEMPAPCASVTLTTKGAVRVAPVTMIWASPDSLAIVVA